MTTIRIDDTLINEVIAVGHYQNAEDAVIKILPAIRLETGRHFRPPSCRHRVAHLVGRPLRERQRANNAMDGV